MMRLVEEFGLLVEDRRHVLLVVFLEYLEEGI